MRWQCWSACWRRRYRWPCSIRGRCAARASGRMAKTDAVDAEVLAHFAEVMKPQPRRWADLETRQLRALVNRRHQLVQMVTAEHNRRRLALAVVRDGFGATLRCLKLQITAINKQLAALIRQMA